MFKDFDIQVSVEAIEIPIDSNSEEPTKEGNKESLELEDKDESIGDPVDWNQKPESIGDETNWEEDIELLD